MKMQQLSIQQLQAQALELVSGLRTKADLEEVIKVIQDQVAKHVLASDLGAPNISAGDLKMRKERALEDYAAGRLIDDEDLDRYLAEEN